MGKTTLTNWIKRCLLGGLALAGFCLGASVLADDLLVAVASNFHATAKDVAAVFESDVEHQVILVPGSTGKLFAQIRNGAPYDVFLAADKNRPERLETEDLAVINTRFTYAKGRLVLWSPTPGYVDQNGEVLRQHLQQMVIANPRLAPYGRATEQVLRALDLWSPVESRLVRGENVTQALQFIQSGQTDLGFIGLSQLIALDSKNRGSHWLVPQTLHDPIEQQGILIKDSTAGRQFIKFLQQPPARNIIESHGYTVDHAG